MKTNIFQNYVFSKILIFHKPKYNVYILIYIMYIFKKQLFLNYWNMHKILKHILNYISTNFYSNT